MGLIVCIFIILPPMYDFNGGRRFPTLNKTASLTYVHPQTIMKLENVMDRVMIAIKWATMQICQQNQQHMQAKYEHRVHHTV